MLRSILSGVLRSRTGAGTRGGYTRAPGGYGGGYGGGATRGGGLMSLAGRFLRR